MTPISGTTQVYGIFGFPIVHTFSPPMHNAAFAATKLNVAYLPFEVKPEALKEAVVGMRALKIAGINVTVPHKIEILPYLDSITETALKIGAVNTVRNENGKLIGTNTDGLGFVRSLSALSFDPQDKTIAILGAGGSTRSILVTLAEAGAKRIILINRTLEKAQALAQEFSTQFPHVTLEANSVEHFYPVPLDLLINTTSVGMKGDLSPVNLGNFQTVRHVADIIYAPLQTPLLKQAETLGIPFINGLGMLLYQACEAFQFWTNQPAPTGVMQAELMKLLA